MKAVQPNEPATERPREAVSWRDSLVTRLLALAVLLATVPVALTGLALLDVNREALDEAARELQVTALDDITRTIDAELAAADGDLLTLARVLSDAGVSEDGRLALAKSQLEASSGLDLVSVYDAQGGLIDSLRLPSARDLEPPAQLEAELRSQAGESAAPVLGPAQFDEGEARVLAVVPIVAGGQVTGFLRAPTRLSDVQARVERVGAAHFTARLGLVVVDREGRLVASARPELAPVGSDAALSDELFGVGDAAYETGLARSGTIGSGADEVVATAVTLPHRQWVVVAQTPTEVAYQSYFAMRRIVVGASLAIMLVSCVFAVGAARRLTAPIEGLVRYAKSLAARDFDARSGVQGRGELALLGRAMEGAASDLAQSEAQLLRETEIRQDLRRYLPAELVERIVAREQDMALGGSRRELTVMFADVVAFTPLTERLEPEAIVKILNELFTICTEIIFRHGGTVDKFIGDSVMAMWGAPKADPEHARNALRAAQDILAWLEIGNRSWRERHGIQVRLAIGVNTGECVVGNIGSESRMEYTAIGDVVNVAARLEAIARPQQILVSGSTREAAGDEFDFAEIGARELAGRAGELTLYEVRT